MSNKDNLLNNKFNKLVADLKDKQVTIDRLKELDKCVVDMNLSTIVLNANERRLSGNLNNSISSNSSGNSKGRNLNGPPYISCEPIPSFMKFLNKVAI